MKKIYKNFINLIVAASIIFIITIPISSIFDLNLDTKKMAEYAFYFLSLSILLSLIEVFKNEK